MKAKEKQKYFITKPRKFVYEKQDAKTAGVKELKPFAGIYGQFRGPVVAVCIILLCVGAVGVLVPIISGKMIALFGVNFDANKVIGYAAMIGGLSLVSALLIIVSDRICGFVAANSNFVITKKLTDKMNATSQKCLDNVGSGTFTSRMFGDVRVVGEAPLKIVDYVVKSVSAVSFVVYLFTLKIWVGLFVFAYLGITIGLEFYRINVRQKNQKVMRDVGERESSLRQENIRGIKDLRGVYATQNLSNMSLDVTKEKYEYSLMGNFVNTRMAFFVRIIKAVLDFSLIALCVHLIVKGEIEIATFLIVYNFRGRITSFSSYIVTVKGYMSDCCLAAQRLNEIMDDNKYPREKFGDKTLDNFEGNIEFKNVRFAYLKDDVLNGVSFKIKPHSINSFVGQSGSGKSTIVSLISKLYDLGEDGGEILFDGVNVKELTEKCLRTSVCTVSQSPYIFNMTIAQNLRLAKPNATDEELIDVLSRANIMDFVQSLPEKLNSKLGENGVKVSGGQKQRLAIARALLTDCKVMVFDEATSALDNFNQKAIKDVVKNLAKDKTIVFIAHRLSTVVDSDNIFIIKDGSVLAQGTHKELMENCDYYRDLYVEEDLKDKH